MAPDVALLASPSPASLPFEIVERKGLGHPDTICDALAENLSATLSRHYSERFGAILHHNVDKALLFGGAARPEFGGGEMLEPIEIYLAGRATVAFRGVRVPVDELAIETSREWLRKHLRFLDLARDVRVIPRIRPTSSDLAAAFARQQGVSVLANDTSFGVGFAPLDDLERIALAVEERLNSAATKAAHPEIGEDVKVMGARRGGEIALTVACALVGRHVTDASDYHAKKTRIAALALDATRALTGVPVTAQVNTADGDTPDSLYVTVTGLSAESGDDGQVGRGNRVNGLITPYRPMSLEAVAGKNPVTHVGKLYNVIANRIAHAVVGEVADVEDAYCFLLSQIGRPIGDPQLFEVKVRLADAGALPQVAPRIGDIARAELARIHLVQNEAIAGTLRVW